MALGPQHFADEVRALVKGGAWLPDDALSDEFCTDASRCTPTSEEVLQAVANDTRSKKARQTICMPSFQLGRTATGK